MSDKATLLGLTVAILAIIGGQVLEGGHVSSILQFTAAIIVLGGTAGAVLVSTTQEDLKTGLKLFKWAFQEEPHKTEETIAQLVSAAQTARRESILALEGQLRSFSDPFTKQVFRFVIDGVDPLIIRNVFESEIEQEEDRLLGGAKMWVDAGGYAPTVGILGAVLGLIHVMENLTDTSKLGGGIAVAFVATIYGVASANLLFLPAGNKIKRKIHHRAETKNMILEGALGIIAGWSPVVLEEKLKAYGHRELK